MPFVNLRVSDPNPQAHLKLKYEVFGSGPMKVLMVMSLGSSYLGWQYQFEHLKKFPEFAVCCFDNRGAGDTSPINFSSASWSSTTKEMAMDALALLDHLEWKGNVHVVGVSMGGMISQQLVLLDVPRFTSLVLVSTHGGSLTKIPHLSHFYQLPKMLFLSPENKIKAMIKLVFTRKKRRRPAPLDFQPTYSRGSAAADTQMPERSSRYYTMEDVWVDLYQEHASKSPPQSFQGLVIQASAALAHRLTDYDFEVLKASNVRILVVSGTIDTFVDPAHSKVLSEKLDAKLRLFQGCGHNIPIEEPGEFNQLLLEWLRK